MKVKKPLGPQQHMGMFETVKVIREQTPITRASDSGVTFGQALDAHIAECAERGQEIQSVTLHFAEDVWADIRDSYVPTYEGETAASPQEGWR